MNAKQIAALLPESETLIQVRFSNDGNVLFSWTKGDLNFTVPAQAGGKGDWETVVKLDRKLFEELPKTAEVFFELNDAAELEIKAGRETRKVSAIHTTINKLPIGEQQQYLSITLTAQQWDIVRIAAEIAIHSETPPHNCVVFQSSKGLIHVFGGSWLKNRDTILWGKWQVETNISVRTFVPAEAILKLIKEKEDGVIVEVSADGKNFHLTSLETQKMHIHGWVPQGEYPNVFTLPTEAESDSSKLELSKAEVKKLADVLKTVASKYTDEVPITLEVKDKKLKVKVEGEGGEELATLPVKTDMDAMVSVTFSALIELFKSVMIAQGITIIFPGAVGQMLRLILGGIGVYYLISVMKAEINKNDPETVGTLTKVEVDLSAPPKVERPKLPANIDEAIAANEKALAEAKRFISNEKANPEKVAKLKEIATEMEAKLEKLYELKRAGATQVPDVSDLYELLLQVMHLLQQIMEEIQQRFPMPKGVGEYTTYVKKVS